MNLGALAQVSDENASAYRTPRQTVRASLERTLENDKYGES